MKYICGISYRVEGLENLPKDKNYIVVSKHQSAWETYFYLPLFQSFNGLCTTFVLKKELLNIPIFGWGLKACGNIAIDRSLGIKSLKQTIKEAKDVVLGEKRNLVIFPQGTRTPINADTTKYPYKIGFLAIAKELKLDLIPVALNTGKFWAKKQFCKKSGEVIIRILPKIDFNEVESKSKQEILDKIENIIEINSKELL
jgi:1-acyl-sn-glycerol-3-phosphate acyltransferase